MNLSIANMRWEILTLNLMKSKLPRFTKNSQYCVNGFSCSLKSEIKSHLYLTWILFETVLVDQVICSARSLGSWGLRQHMRGQKGKIRRHGCLERWPGSTPCDLIDHVWLSTNAISQRLHCEKGKRFSRPQPGCRLPNFLSPGII